jgi:hypothetical protein
LSIQQIITIVVNFIKSRGQWGVAIAALAYGLKGTGIDVAFESVVPFLNSSADVLAAAGVLLAVIGRALAKGPLIEIGEKMQEAEDPPAAAPPPA